MNIVDVGGALVNSTGVQFEFSHAFGAAVTPDAPPVQCAGPPVPPSRYEITQLVRQLTWNHN
jgi:hypothetical protein